MSLVKVNMLLQEAGTIASDSGGNYEELKRSNMKSREAFELVRDMLKIEPNNGLLWELMCGCMSQSGIWIAEDGDYHQAKVEVIEHMLRLNPEDDDSHYKDSYFEPDYAYDGGLYFYHYSALRDAYYNDQGHWDSPEYETQARQSVNKAIKLHPHAKEFLLEEIKAVNL